MSDACGDEACELGVLGACADGEQEVCIQSGAGCPEQDTRACVDGGCLCPFTDSDVVIEQWNGSSAGRGLAILAHDGQVLVAGGFGGTLPGQMRYGKSDMFVRAQIIGSTVEDAFGLQFGTAESDVVNGLAVDATGALFAAGEMAGSYEGSTSFGASDGSLTKWSSEGALEWQDQWGTLDSDGAYAVALASDGEIFVAGFTRGDLVQANGGEEDAVLRKLDADGEELWTLQWGGVDRDLATSVVAPRSWPKHTMSLGRHKRSA